MNVINEQQKQFIETQSDYTKMIQSLAFAKAPSNVLTGKHHNIAEILRKSMDL